MRITAALLLALSLALAACATTGPEPKKSETQTAPTAASHLEADRDLAATLRGITARGRRGEAAKMRDEFIEQAKLRPNDWKPRLFAAWTGQPGEDAWQDVAKVCKLSPEEPWPWTASGLIYLQWKNFIDQAESEFKKALVARRDFVPARIGLADVLRHRGKHAEAKAAYEAVLKDAPDWQEALLGLGLAEAALGDAAAARPHLERALQVDPDDLIAVDALAKLALEAKDSARAIELYGKMLQFNPRDRAAHLALAKMKTEAGDAAGAAQSCEAAMAIAPDLETARTLAGLYQSLKKNDEEVKAQETVAKLDTKDPAPYVRIADIRRGENDTEGAETALRQAAERAPNDGAIHLAIARLVAAKEDLVASIEAFRTAKAKGAADAEKELKELEEKANLGPQIVGDPNKVYGTVGARLNKQFQDLQKANPALGGKMRARVTIGADGVAGQVEMLEDTVHDGGLTALIYFSLKDAKYPKKSTPTFEFVLNPATPAKKK
ncbi:MAG TPA: tetratricopeptide repeat protein [Myxococcales bacterium]